MSTIATRILSVTSQLHVGQIELGDDRHSAIVRRRELQRPTQGFYPVTQAFERGAAEEPLGIWVQGTAPTGDPQGQGLILCGRAYALHQRRVGAAEPLQREAIERRLQ